MLDAMIGSSAPSGSHMIQGRRAALCKPHLQGGLGTKAVV